jgi:hypothetical protein
MIQAVLSDALNGVKGTQPRGGFTDVGLHTGGHPRNTSWPLLRAVLQVLIESKTIHLLYRIAMAEFLLRIVEDRIAAVMSSDAAEISHDSIMQMLQAAVREGEALADDDYDKGHDMELFQARCVVARHRLDQAVQCRAESAALLLALPSMHMEDLACRPPCITLPANATPKWNGSATLSDIRALASTNIGWLPEPLESGTWQELSAWLAHPRLRQKQTDTATLQHVLSTVEKFLFNLSRKLVPRSVFLTLDERLDPDIVVMERVVDAYRQSAAALRSSTVAAALMAVELASRELLVVWVAFCISHSVTKTGEPLLKDYAVALRWQDLQHVVLSEKLAVDAALSVAEYLRANGMHNNKSPVFSLRAKDATIDLATRHSMASISTQGVWRTETAAANQRRTQHWNEVQTKKQMLVRLDQELAVLTNSLRIENRALAQLEPPLGYGWGKRRTIPTSIENDNQYREVQSAIFSLELQINSKTAVIKSAEKPPPPILQPLPQQEPNAMPVLFFLQMPANFQVLSRLSFTAQQMLLPPSAVVRPPRSEDEIDVDEEIECDPPPVDWRTYYLATSTARSHDATTPKVILGTTGKVVSGDWYPKNVRSYHSMSDGVWHPDSMGTALFWCGGRCALDDRRGGYFNPFKYVEPCVTVQWFTEQLPPSDKSMQYTMEQHGDASEPSRGNVPEAEQDNKPDWLASKQHHLAFGALRAYPNQQLRKLCVALREKDLPLNELGVHLLLRQTLFQLGALSDEAQPRPHCRTDMERFGGWAALRAELHALAEELRCKCREHQSILILGELAAVVSQWDPQTRDVSREFADIAWKWGLAVASEMEDAAIEALPSLRARQCLFTMYSIVCHTAGELTVGDVEALLAAVVLADYSRLFEDSTPYDSQLRALTTVSHQVLARRLHEVLRVLDAHPQLITSAVRGVLEGVPTRLDWRRVADGATQTQTFEAVSASGHLYSVNVMTGVLLFDGLPPRKLPATILQMPLYKRTFADRNFEVVATAAGVLRSTRLVMGCRYEFSLTAQNTLIVRETNAEQEVFELLDGTETGVLTWGSQLPVRLREMHSHWLCREQNTVLLRGKLFHDRDVSFFLASSYPFSFQKKTKKCYRVKEHHAHLPLKALLERRGSFDLLNVIAPADLECRALKVLAKFETDARFIHTLLAKRGGSRNLVFELPRYDFSFSLAGDGKLWSENFRGCFLSEQQILPDTLHGFQQYLVLESCTSGGTQVVVPAGEIRKNSQSRSGGGARVSVDGSSRCDAARKALVFHIHPRFGSLDVAAGPHAVEARLQLAALYAATDSEVPERRSRRTGGEVAMELLRQSWVNRPLTSTECTHLRSVSSFDQFTPALSMLCSELQSSAQELSFLHTDGSSRRAPGPSLSLACEDACTEYEQRKQSGRLSPCAFLSDDEETRVLGLKVADRPRGRRLLPGTLGPRASPAAIRDKCARLFSDVEGDLTSMVRGEVVEPSPFPFDVSSFQDTEIGNTMIGELQESWDADQSKATARLAVEVDVAAGTISSLLTHTSELRLELENAIMQDVDRVPASAGWHAAAFNMRRSANLAPRVTTRDLARASWQAETELRRFNPFLSETAVQELRADILVWLQACVLEDKLTRMRALASALDAQELGRELQEVGPRQWSVAQHPQWLVFEVEQRLQIRRVQYKVAQELIDCPGSVTQLNMGEGKTRVILPMLVLALAQPERLMRLHFLTPLLGEAYDFLHRHLTASLTNRRIFQLPFNRNVRFESVQDVRKMHDCLLRCQAAGGAVCVAPEHRLSLELKWHELQLADSPSTAEGRQMLQTVESMKYFDLYDESDEALHHRFQLIYAVGACHLLPNGRERWVVAQALLKQVQTNAAVAKTLRAPDVARRLSRLRTHGAGAFDDLRLLPGEQLEKQMAGLLRELAAGVISDPPYPMRWLKKYQTKPAVVSTIITFVTDPEKSCGWFELQPGASNIKELQLMQLLAMRGLLACGMLAHCLSRRHRVDYGVDSRRGKARRVAVPYRASDTPSERAEYAQPDTLIVFTLLSYYHRGLSRDEVREAGRELLTLGPIAQRAEYCLWLETARPAMAAEQLAALDHVDKLDMSNEQQVDLLEAAFRFNMAAIEFWLDACVFPRETMQYPARLVANAFNLASNAEGQVVGFSGTKDNSLLLPLQVGQRLPDELLLRATDGQMLSLVGNRQAPVKVFDSSQPLSAALLEFAVVESGADALIDAGASMAGLSNGEVARQALKLLSPRHEGVVYFETAANSWRVLSRRGSTEPLHGGSPIHESDAFVYFDESRCRGADMKLKADATAVLTLGSGMTKDKLMQAAGRMRKLFWGSQKLIFGVPSELSAKIRAACGVRNDRQPLLPLYLAHWVLKNTVQATIEGLAEWGAQGSYFDTTCSDPRARLVDERLGLGELYAAAITEQTVCSQVLKRQEHDRQRLETLGIHSPLPTGAAAMGLRIAEHAARFGSDVVKFSANIDEECEREVENERELEREVQRQIPRMAAAEPAGWDFSAALRASTPALLPAAAGVMSLTFAVKQYLSLEPGLGEIDFAACGLYATRNFFKTVATEDGGAVRELSHYLRPVDALLLFPSGEGLLLSEWEADSVLGLMWAAGGGSSGGPSFANFAYLRSDLPQQQSLRISPPCTWQMQPPEHMLAGLELFAGGTMLRTAARKQAAEQVLPSPRAKVAALALAAMRGLQHMVPRSDLEEICAVDIGEK